VEVQRLHEAHPGTRIVVLANRPTSGDCDQLLSFGATACLSKDTEARDIINAIHLASRGMHVLPRSAAAGGGLERLGAHGTGLTPREAEVLELLQDGWSNSGIADDLSIGIETVRTHARNIYRKLGIASRRELARLARQEPVVVDDERRPVSAQPGRFERASGGARDAEQSAHVE
jgi:NarL family two-component system response regulator LiaR